MSPSPGEEAPASQDSKHSGGLAGVFKGLTGSSKLSKSTPSLVQASAASTSTSLTEHYDPMNSSTSDLPTNDADALDRLRTGLVHERIEAADQLRNAVLEHPLHPVLDIWYAAKNMIDHTNANTTRTSGWALLTVCLKHASSTDIERKEFFQTITGPANPEDFHLQLAALVELTNHGRKLSGFEYDVFPLVISWLRMKFESVRVARKQASRTKGKAVASGEDRDFNDLFAYTTDLIKFNFGYTGEAVSQDLIEVLHQICLSTSGPDDLRACIGVFIAIITFGAIPNEKLKLCVEVLSSIHCLVPNLQKNAWHALSMLYRSHNGHAVVRILLGILKGFSSHPDPKKDGVREVRGALSALQKLVSKSTEKGYPVVPYGILVEGLTTVVESSTNWKIHLDVLRLTNALVDARSGNVNPMIVDEDWGALLDVASSCTAVVISPSPPTEESSKSLIERESKETSSSIIGHEITKLVSRLEQLLGDNPQLLQRQDCISFFCKINKILPDSAAIKVLDYFQEFRCCYPSDTDWEANLRLVLDVLFANRTRSSQLRVQALRTVTEVYDMVELVHDQLEPDFVPKLVKDLLRDIAEETDIIVLQDIVKFTTGIACNAEMPLFDYVVDTLHGVLTVDRLRSPFNLAVSRSPPTPTDNDQAQSLTMQTPSNVVARGYVQIFMQVMHSDTVKTVRLFDIFVSMIKSIATEVDARLTAMKLLFRLRADWANRIYVTMYTETEHLAALLCRTDGSLAKKISEDASQSGRVSRVDAPGRISRGVSFGQGQLQERSYSDRSFSVRSSGGARGTTGPKYQQIWSASEPDVLPEASSRMASPVLYSHIPDAISEVDGKALKDAILPTSKWLNAIISLLQQGCDWEVFSYLLVYLPAQLSNHGMFKGAITQIQELRKVVCEQFRTNGFQEPPNASGLRRADVAICLFQALTMILSYHQHFQKQEEDEIVSTFLRGITTYERCAKSCIHALSICCYELPMSTSKSLVTILQKMSQIITQPSVAIHILEFLACLARRPSLYVNFREEEYRIVFGICFRYLQYVREKKQSFRTSIVGAGDATTLSAGASGPATEVQGSPSASDDLPQYVYALAYHVVTFWFLALKLPDRANHVGWIAKNLFTDVDGSQVAEEQAQITIDFMQRVAYANANESQADPYFTSEQHGEIVSRRWLIGNSIVTVEQATLTGWAQITKRQPSGTSSYMIRESFRAPPAHQERTTNEVVGLEGDSDRSRNVLPSHLLVQLLSSMPQCTDAARPIPLPEDDVVKRAIRMFDLNSTVDGHKVGVIYIGENQCEEAEILPNVSGSREYVEFLDGLGTLTKLKDAQFNTQGLDRQFDMDGEFTFCWRDRVTEIIFHVITQMPTNLEMDPQCNRKKSHIGNDFVNIIFNDSGLPFKFDTFPSEFNFVNIVITPESRASFVATRQRAPKDVRESFYNVQVMSKPGFPEISPASDTKVLSLKALPDFIRLVALNASVFSSVWANRDGGEQISPWRNRLREILRLREKYGPTPTPPGTAMSGTGAGSLPVQMDTSRPGSTVRESITSLRRSSVATFFSGSSEPNTHSHRSSTLSNVSTEGTEIMPPNGGETLVDRLDFSKWA